MDPRERYRSPEQGVRAALVEAQSATWTTMPGIIESFDPVAVTAVVRVAIQGEIRKPDRSVEFVELPMLPDVPVVFPRGGGYTMTFPIKKGDEVLIHFAARNIDGWWQQGGVQKPLDRRMHDLSDAFCTLGPQSQKAKIENISPTKMQIRSNEATPKLLIEFDTDGKKITVSNDGLSFVLDKDAGKITLTAPTEIVIDCPLVTVKGKIEAEGEVVAKKTADNISLSTHRHSGVTPGAGNTAPPVAGT